MPARENRVTWSALRWMRSGDRSFRSRVHHVCGADGLKGAAWAHYAHFAEGHLFIHVLLFHDLLDDLEELTTSWLGKFFPFIFNPGIIVIAFVFSVAVEN